MNNKNNVSSILNKQEYEYITEESFYPPSDNRYLTSCVEDIDGGDNFTDYCEYIFELLEENGYYD